MHAFLGFCAVVALCGSAYVGHLAFDLCREDLESKSVQWAHVACDFLILGAAVCGIVSSLYAFSGALLQ